MFIVKTTPTAAASTLSTINIQNQQNTYEHGQVVAPYQQSNVNHQMQSSYYNYLNSFYNNEDKQNSALLKKKASDSHKQSMINNSNQHSKPSQFTSKIQAQQQNQQIMSMKKSASSVPINLDKYQVYEASRQLISNLSTQHPLPHHQAIPVSSYSSQSMSNPYQVKMETFRVVGGNFSQGSPHEDTLSKKSQRKSVSKENQNNISSKILQEQQSLKNSQNNTVSKGGKNKSRVVKSSLKNQNTITNEQMIAFYMSNTSELKNSGSPTREQGSSSRYDMQTEEMLRNKMVKLQQNYASMPQNIKSQRTVGKSISLRNNIQMKLKTINPHSNQFDSFENLNGQFQSNFALSAKNQTNPTHIFSTTQPIKSPHPRESFQHPANSQKRNATSDITAEYNDSINNIKNGKRIQQKIQKIAQASGSSKSTNQSNTMGLQNSYSQGNLRKTVQQINQTKIFRPQSLKHLMPTIDEQIMKLTDMMSPDYQSLTNADQPSQFLFKTLSDNNKNSQSRVSQAKLPLYPNQPTKVPAKTVNQSHLKNSSSMFNHKESIEGGAKSDIQSHQEDNIEEKSHEDHTNVQDQLKDIMIRTQLALEQYKKREVTLTQKCKQQEEEINTLRQRLLDLGEKI